MHLLRSKHQVTHIDAYFKIGWEILYSMAYKNYVACLQNVVPSPSASGTASSPFVHPKVCKRSLGIDSPLDSRIACLSQIFPAVVDCMICNYIASLLRCASDLGREASLCAMMRRFLLQPNCQMECQLPRLHLTMTSTPQTLITSCFPTSRQ